MEDAEGIVAQAFDLFDSKHTGFVSPSKLKGLLHTLDINISSAEQMELLKRLEVTGEDKIAREDFLRIIPSYMVESCL